MYLFIYLFIFNDIIISIGIFLINNLLLIYWILFNK